MNKSESIIDLVVALVKAQAEIKGAVKDANNPHFRSQYADLESVWEAVREPLTKNGLCVIQLPSADEMGVSVETMLCHSSGQFVSEVLRMVPVKNDPQGVGSCITYARRYALQSVVGVAPKDDDGEAASGRGASAVGAMCTPQKAAASKEAPLPGMKQGTSETYAAHTGAGASWHEFVCSWGKEGGPLKGKRLGELTPKNLDWLKSKLEEAEPAKRNGKDKALLEMIEQSFVNQDDGKKAEEVQDEIPMEQTAHDKLRRLIMDAKWDLGKFMSLANRNDWTAGGMFSEITEAEAVKIVAGWDDIQGYGSEMK